MPAKQPKALLLTPGASAGREQSSLVAIDEAATACGLVVERMDFPYKAAGRKRIDSPPVLLEAVASGAGRLAAEAGCEPSEIALGGRSMGGRICSMAVAAGLPAAALVLVSYPLHPPGKPANLRTEHFKDLRLPCLFVSGTRDAFGTPAELARETAAIPGEVTRLFIEGGDHSLRGKDAQVAEAVSAWLASAAGRRRAPTR
jgi:predicted alpha/beta-hydrolase family hydrolase